MAVTAKSKPRLASNLNLLSAASSATPDTPWVRPSSWTSLPSVTGQQRFAGLHRIDVDGNFVALTAAGAYTVDWGDGTTTNHATGTTAQKTYDYTTISSTGESTLGYRQVIIQVYPQSGSNLTSLSLAVRHSTSSVSYATGWLDVIINASYITSLVFSGITIPARYLQQATVLNHNLTNMASMFAQASALQSIPLFNTASITNMSSAFINCASLQSVPLFNTASVTNMSNMFQGCTTLQSVPLFNTASVTSMASMFQACTALQSVPLFNTASALAMNSMFQSCAALQSVPLFNTALCQNLRAFVYQCGVLQSFPLINTAACVNISACFYGCFSLSSIPTLNLSSNATVSDMFSGCNSLVSIPALNLSSVSSAANMATFASGCASLSSVACTGINQTISFASSKLSASQIDAIFGNLSSSGSGKTITVTGNYGAATCTTSIATAKGWTVAI